MGAQRAAWTIAFNSECATASGVEHAVTMLDLMKAFEKLSHALIILAAVKRGYNLVVLRLSLAAYRMQRVVGIDGVYAIIARATCGITAGSGFATTELRLLLLDVDRSVATLWPVRLTPYVDD